MKQLKNQKEANELRAKLLEEQGYICPITGFKLTMGNCVLDHNHRTGHVRGVIFGGANRVLQDTQWIRYGLRPEIHALMLRNMADYIEKEPLDYLHHACRPQKQIIKKSNYIKLGKLIIKDKGAVPSWWGYVETRGRRGQHLSDRLKALYDKYGLEPEYY